MLIQMGEQKHNRERNGVLDLRLLNKERVALQVRVKDWNISAGFSNYDS